MSRLIMATALALLLGSLANAEGDAFSAGKAACPKDPNADRTPDPTAAEINLRRSVFIRPLSSVLFLKFAARIQLHPEQGLAALSAERVTHIWTLESYNELL